MDKIAIIISIFSVAISFVALLMVVLNKKQDMRPWIAIEDVGYEFADNDCFRVNAKVKKVIFSCCIKSHNYFR